MPVGHRNIIAWQRAMDLTVAIDSLNRPLRRAGEPNLPSQLMRAAVSVPSNIAEGRGRAAPRDFARFCAIALGSLREVETLLVLVQRLGLVASETTEAMLRQADEVGKVLFGLQRATRNSIPTTRRPTSRVCVDIELAIR